MNPAITVVVVADNLPPGGRRWVEERALLAALARQRVTEPVEYLWVDRAAPPPEVAALLPGLRVVASDAASAGALKNAGVAAARAELVAVLDADVVPGPDWLGVVLGALRGEPDLAVVCGHSVYPGDSLGRRLFTLLDRGYADLGAAGPTPFLAENNCGFRRAVMLEHPFLEMPFSAMPHRAALRRAGHRVRFEPAMVVTHSFDGWRTVRRVRQQQGYVTIATRRRDPQLPYASVARLGVVSLPFFAAARTLFDWSVCWRLRHRLRWYELPLALGLSGALRLAELPGMVRGLRGPPPVDGSR